MRRSISQNKYLTKSRYLTGLSCPKAIWLTYNKPEKLPEVDQTTQDRFNDGYRVGELAKALFQNGIDIKEVIPDENHKKSMTLLKKRKPLFEAGFIHKNGKCYARADILAPAGSGRWDIIEVKSSTGVKDYHLEDISFQKYCYESFGIRISKCYLLHINNEYVRDGKIDPKEFFAKSDVTEYIEQLMPDVPKKVKAIFDIISLKKCPEFKRGEVYHDDSSGIHDDDRFWKEHPETDILDLYMGGQKAIGLFNQGVFRMKDIPEDFKLSDKQKIQQQAHISKKPYVNGKEISAFMKSLEYPLYFLDFETYSTAIPLYNGLRPYQQIPFQFSLHVIKNKKGKIEHYSFIAEGDKDPRIMFINKLKKVAGKKGSIVIYNRSFEKGVLEKISSYHPEYQEWVDETAERMIDLLIPFRNFYYYHPLQKGSASLKYVLPALTGMHYGDFEIGNGAQASSAYLYITHGSYDGKDATPKEIKKIRDALEEYCGQDTEGMIHVLEKLDKAVKQRF